MSHFRRLGLVAALMSAFLVFMLSDNTIRRATGEEVRLAVTGYDPRDPFMGHYSRIQLDIANLDASELAGDDDLEIGQTVYVTIAQQGDGEWAATAITHERPSDGIALMGLVNEVWRGGFEWVSRENPETGETAMERVARERLAVQIDYGLNRYFADRETARELDAILRDETQSPRLIISVTEDGRALIKGIEINGEAHYERLL